MATAINPISLNPSIGMSKPQIEPAKDHSKWFAVFTFSRHEKQVQAQCERQSIECFLPVYLTRHRWKNRCTVNLELPLFPNYLFVRIDPRERVQVVKHPGVISILSSGRELLPIPDHDICALRAGLITHRMEPHVGIEVGERVRITTGPMCDAEGILERRKNDLRVILRLDMLARSVSVEVGANEIERVDNFVERPRPWSASMAPALAAS